MPQRKSRILPGKTRRRNQTLPGRKRPVNRTQEKNLPGRTAAAATENPLAEIAAGLYAEYDACLSRVDFSGAAAAVQKLAQRANLYVEEMAPWNLAKSEETAGELAAVIYNLLEAIRVIALFMAPLAPNTSAEVFRRLSLGAITDITDIEAASAWGQLSAGNAVETGDPLFPRLDADAIDFEIE